MTGPEDRIARLRFRAWHRGTREADYLIGGFFDRYHADWTGAQVEWFENLLEVDDPDILDWALGKQQPPDRFAGDMMDALRKLDYVEIPR